MPQPARSMAGRGGAGRRCSRSSARRRRLSRPSAASTTASSATRRCRRAAAAGLPAAFARAAPAALVAPSLRPGCPRLCPSACLFVCLFVCLFGLHPGRASPGFFRLQADSLSTGGFAASAQNKAAKWQAAAIASCALNPSLGRTSCPQRRAVPCRVVEYRSGTPQSPKPSPGNCGQRGCRSSTARVPVECPWSDAAVRSFVLRYDANRRNGS